MLCLPFETSHAAAQIQRGKEGLFLTSHCSGTFKGVGRNLSQLLAMYLPVLTGVFS